MLFTTLFINSVVCWSPKLVTMLSPRRKFFRWHLSDNSLLATSWILFYEALKRIMFITTLFINSVVCWSPKMVTTFYTHWKVFRKHLSNISLLATSWILFYEALKRIMFITTLFINSLVCWSPKMVTTFFSASQVFLLTSFWHFGCRNFVNVLYEALKRIMLFTTLFINSVVCWSPKLVTTFYTHWKVFRQHLSNNWLLATSWILFYEALERIMFITTFFINSVVYWSPKMVTTFYTHWKVFRQHLSNNWLLATSWILFYEALKRIMFITTLFINSVVCWSPKMVTTIYTHCKVFRKLCLTIRF